MFTYKFDGELHSDITVAYMTNLGMDSEQISSVHADYEYVAANINERRKKAYAAESDHLFIKWQRERLPEQEQAWLDKVAEIQERIPKMPTLNDNM